MAPVCNSEKEGAFPRLPDREGGFVYDVGVVERVVDFLEQPLREAVLAAKALHLKERVRRSLCVERRLAVGPRDDLDHRRPPAAGPRAG